MTNCVSVMRLQKPLLSGYPPPPPAPALTQKEIASSEPNNQFIFSLGNPANLISEEVKRLQQWAMRGNGQHVPFFQTSKMTFKRILQNQIPIESDRENDEYNDENDNNFDV